MKRSIIAAVAVAALGLISMGGLGGLLYYAIYPVAAPIYGDLNDWRGDDVWPAMIMTGMMWSLSFPVAGWIDRRLAAGGRSTFMRRASYGAILWLGALAVWGFALSTSAIHFSPI